MNLELTLLGIALAILVILLIILAHIVLKEAEQPKPELTREDYIIAFARFTNMYAKGNSWSAFEMLKNLGYTSDEVGLILEGAEAVTICNPRIEKEMQCIN